MLGPRIVIAGLALGAIAAAPAPGLEHRLEVDHRSGPMAVHYTADVDVAYDQVGTPAPGGRLATLRCRWEANLSVDRQARHENGGTMGRTIESVSALEGSRPGWCRTSRAAIRQEIAARTDELRAHLLAIAEEDRASLLAEVDVLHGTATAG